MPEFDELLRARLGDRVVLEMQGMADTLADSLRSVLFEGEADVQAAFRRNVEQFREAALRAIDRWAESMPAVQKRTVEAMRQVDKEVVVGLAYDAYTYAVRSKQITKRNGGIPTMTTTFTKRGDVLEAATAEARKLQKTRPELSLVEARGEVWRTNSTLADAYASLPPEPVEKADSNTTARTAGTAGRSSAPVDQGAEVIAVLDEISREAYELVRTGKFSSLPLARAEAWRSNPDLQRRYQEANAG